MWHSYTKCGSLQTSHISLLPITYQSLFHEDPYHHGNYNVLGNHTRKQMIITKKDKL